MLWLVGAGPMAYDYAKVLIAQNVSFKIVGRGEKSAQILEKSLKTEVVRGGFEKFITCGQKVKNVIIAVGIEQLTSVAIKAINAGVERILIEKPAGTSLKEISKLSALAKKKKVKIFVAYNRRFYQSVSKARQIISADGGVESFVFDFTELSDQVKNLSIPIEVKERWIFANSSHVIDLAFNLCGNPLKLKSMVSGGNSWHPSGSVYAGCGLTLGGALFSYHANWESGGRWGIEIMTPKRRLIFRPLEKLQEMIKGSFSVSSCVFDESIDNNFKPGLFKQVQAFLQGPGIEYLCSIEEHKKNTRNYCKISGYNEGLK
jgi:predicted dehydrogenase